MRGVGVVVFCLAALLAFNQPAAASSPLRVNESITRVSLETSQVGVSLAIENQLARPVAAHARVELVDTRGRVRASSEMSETIKPGLSQLVIALAFEFSTLKPDEIKQVYWYRLRYKLSYVSARVPAPDSISGIISLSEITPDLFELKAIKPLYAAEGSGYRVQARALQPFTGHPVKDVSVDAELKIETPEGNRILKASTVTDREGYAVFNFNLPSRIGSSEGEIRINGRRGAITQAAEGSVRIDRWARIIINTDKPLYQPGQVLHVRALALTPSKRAMAGTDLILKIKDPEEMVVYRAAIKTSRFGIASADWTIPANVRLGDYEIRLDINEDDEEDVYCERHQVRISRYELPNFAVRARPDRDYYLPGQNAEVVISGDYLFGQPVTRGRVRVVEEQSREWNYREQKWEIEEGNKYEGELDKSGRFVARIDLSKTHKELSESSYSRFEDVSFAAYITDSTTNRTEQRKFDLRVTKEAIHVYIIDDYRGPAKLPLEFYVTTFYPDGSPARCDVIINERVVPTGERASSDDYYERPLRVVKTNRYGLAKVSILAAANRDDDLSFSLEARDSKGQSGHYTAGFWHNSNNYLRVTTTKTIHRAGEPVEVRIRSAGPDEKVFIDVGRDWKVLRSETVELRRGQASITLPYGSDFKGELTIAAYTHNDSMAVGARTVLYPNNRELKVDVKPAQSVYRPGEEAAAMFTVQSPGGATTSALGISVTDRAVDERASADLEFGSRYGFYQAYNRIFGMDESMGGVSRASLDKLDLTKPVSADLDLVAEVLLRRPGYLPDSFDSRSNTLEPNDAFRFLTDAQLRPVASALDTRYSKTREHPTTAGELNDILAQFGIDFSRMRDPWGTIYRASFGVDCDQDTLTVTTAGADKRFDTADDFAVFNKRWSYFAEVSEMINRATIEYHRRAGGFIRDLRTLNRELLDQGFNLDALRDRWGKPYQIEFGINKNDFTIIVKSGGENRRIDSAQKYSSDDFTIWTAKIDYFAATRVKVERALINYLNAISRFPQDEVELAQALKQEGIDWSELRDPWGNRYYATFKPQSRYGDSVKIYTYATYRSEDELARRTEITPVTRKTEFIYLESAGADGKSGTADDFEAASFARIVSEQSVVDEQAKQSIKRVVIWGETGAITGTVTDAQGAVIPGAKVKATKTISSLVYEAVTTSEGKFSLSNLPVGTYEVRFDAYGFSSAVIAGVPVNASSVTDLVASLVIGTITEAVMVSAEAVQLQTEKTSVGIDGAQAKAPPLNRRQIVTRTGDPSQVSTPRLREYFPETLLWQPSLETDAEGRAQLKFKLADNITTWKISVIASTVEGEIGMAEEEIRAFQPFFVEHDPPRILTEGDEISLPVVLRNYLDREQKVAVEIRPESWFTLLGPARKQSAVAAGDGVRETFDFRVAARVKDGSQRITATSAEASDAIEKLVTALPDGEEITETASQIFSDLSSLQINIPETTIKGTARAELKVYPNLSAHIVEGIEAIMQRPFGCGEQTISSAYPSLFVLRHFKRRGEDFPPLAQKARRYLQSGYERLLNYRDEGGGFSYWGRGEADTALTAYALRFLNDARDLIAVDDEVIEEARQWLINKQRNDGSWLAHVWSGSEDRARTAMLTALVARSLAHSTASKLKGDAGKVPIKQAEANRTALKRALDYLRARSTEIDEPYLIASTAIAAFDAGETSAARQSIKKLRGLARAEGSQSYWSLESNTPFYGWGLAGRIEASALAVEALARDQQTSDITSQSQDDLVDRGLLFLIRQKDRHGVWHSTQATVGVLDTLMTLLARGKADAHKPAEAQAAEIFVNGKRVASVALPPENQLSSPATIDLSQFLSPGTNRVEVRRNSTEQASAQLVASYYTAWTADKTNAARKLEQRDASALRLKVNFDKSEAKINDEITCRVEAERIGFKGYGMMLAEIGLPPGADVDRSSLDEAMKDSGWTINYYDVLPDRVIFYLWPEAGGVKFQFKFRPRFGLKAQSASSILYDYYNPEARTVVQPTKFVVK